MSDTLKSNSIPPVIFSLINDILINVLIDYTCALFKRRPGSVNTWVAETRNKFISTYYVFSGSMNVTAHEFSNYLFVSGIMFADGDLSRDLSSKLTNKRINLFTNVYKRF